jgi:hypothetical protein
LEFAISKRSSTTRQLKAIKAWGRMIIFAVILFMIHRKFWLKMVLAAICIGNRISHSKAELSTVLEHLQTVLTYVRFRKNTSCFLYSRINYADQIKAEDTLFALIEKELYP